MFWFTMHNMNQKGRKSSYTSMPAVWLFALLACEAKISTVLSRQGAESHDVVSGVDKLLGSDLALKESCGDTIVAQLHALGNESNPGAEPLLSTPVGSNGSYRFDLKASHLPSVGKDKAYSVVVKGCSFFHGRIVTKSHADIDANSSLFLYAISRDLAVSSAHAFDQTKLADIGRLKWNLDTLNDTQDINQSFATLSNSQALSLKFTELFGMPVSSLMDAPPKIIRLQVPPGPIPENQGAGFAVSAAHWNKDYKIATQWRIADVTVSTSRNFVYNPDANSQGLHTVTLILGREKNSAWDDKSPYQKYDVPIEVLDSFPAKPPALKLLSKSVAGDPPTVRDRRLRLAWETGKGLAECSSFTKMAITENTAMKPGAFPLTCNAEGEQEWNYTLGTSGDGVKVLRLWAQDASGKIGDVPVVLTVRLDTQPMAFQSLPLINDVADGYLNAAEKSLSRALVGAVTGSGFDSVTYKVVPSATICDGMLTYATTIPTNMSGELTSDGIYKVCVALNNINEAPTVHGASANFTVTTVLPIFTSIALANEATDGFINGADHALSHDLVDSLVASGYSKLEYGLVASTTLCKDMTGYQSSVPKNDDARFTTDGNYKVCVRLSDVAGNTTFGVSANIALAVTPPGNFSFSAPGTYVTSTTPTVTWTAATGAQSYDLLVGTASGCASPSQTHAGLSVTTATLSALSDGTYYLCVKAKDAAGNTTAASNDNIAFTVDSIPPGAFSITSPGAATQLTTPTVTWGAATDAAGYDLYVDDESSCSAPYLQSFAGVTGTSQALGSLSVGATYYICLVAKDAAGNMRQAINSPFALIVDKDKPTLSALTINNGDATTSNTNVTLALTANDATSKITHVCIKMDDAAPPVSVSDNCWIAVTSPAIGQSPAKNLTVNSLPYSIGYVSTLYTLYGWVRDEAQNVSQMSAAGLGTTGIDKNAINFGPESPPVINRVFAAGSDAPSNPMSSSDMTIAAGADVYVKWRVTSTNPLGATPITLQFTTDDVTFTNIASGLQNGQNGGCSVDNMATTLDDNATGCYLWASGAPTSSYFKIRVMAEDSHRLTSTAPSQPINPGAIRNLAGNTELGLGGSAKSAVFFNAASVSPDPHSLVVTDAGIIYFRDVVRGILKIDPADEVQRVLIPTTGVASGDGGPIANATLRYPFKMALDPQNRLLIYDFDRIRRVDFVANRIETIIGGGSNLGDDADPLTVRVVHLGSYESGYSTGAVFAVMPNGDIYFNDALITNSPSTGWRFRVYRESTGKVGSITPSGTGIAGNPGRDISTCAIWAGAPVYDKISTSVTGFLVDAYCDDWTEIALDANGVSTAPHPPPASWMAAGRISRTGELYNVDFGVVNVYRPATHDWQRILGAGRYQDGFCQDGTPALSCHITIRDAFLTTLGKLYFIDHSMIRSLDTASNVVSLYGQTLFFGDDGPATEARFHSINNLALGNSGKIVILDEMENRFRQFTPNGNVELVAGNGDNNFPSTSGDPRTQPLWLATAGSIFDDFVMDPVSENIYFNRGSYKIAYLDRSLNRWVDLVGGGATLYENADGLLGNAIDMPGYPSRLLGLNGSSVVASKTHYDPSFGFMSGMVKQYGRSDGSQSHLLGIRSVSSKSELCSDGTAGNACELPTVFNNSVIMRMHFDSHTNDWLLLHRDRSQIRSIAVGGAMSTFANLGQNAISFTYHRTADGLTKIIFYCGTDGVLHKYNLNTLSDATLAWAIPSMKCTGRSIVYDSVQNAILFPYTQNGLAGVAQYLAP